MYTPVKATQGDRTVEAIQYTGKNRHILARWCNRHISIMMPGVLEIQTYHGAAPLAVGDWLIAHAKSFAPVSRLTFENCYKIIGPADGRY